MWEHVIEPDSVKRGRSVSPQVALAAAVGAVVFPIVLALMDEARFGSFRPVARGDEAILELHVGQAMRLTHLLGPYSQFGWYHPGPLYYYLLSPFYLLSGAATRSLNVGVALFNLGAAAAMIALAARLETGRTRRLLGVLVVAAFVSALATRVPDGALITNPLIEIWNPLAPVLPFGLLIFVAAAVARGRLELLPGVAFLHAFTIQTHVSYAPPATLLAVGAVAWVVGVERSVSRARLLRALAITAAVSFVLWLPPLVALVFQQPGNAWAILRFAGSNRLPHLPIGAALAYGLRQIHAPSLYWLGFSVGSGTWLAVLLTLLELAAAAVCLRARARREAPYAAVLAAVTALLTAVALTQSSRLVSLKENIFYYQTLWFGLVGCLGWFPIAYALRAALLKHAERLVPWAAAVLPLGAWVLAGLAAHAVTRDFARCRERAPARPESAELAVPVLAKVFAERSGKGAEYVLDGGAPGTGAAFTSSVLELTKLGIRPTMAAEWRLILGNGARYGAPDRPTLHVSRLRLHDDPLWRGLGTTMIYAERIDRRAAAGDMPLGCRLIDTQGEVRHAERVCDARSRGRAGKAPPAALLVRNASITVELGAVTSPDRFLEGLRLNVDASDAFRIEGSRDGKRFVDLGRARPRDGKGLRWRSFYFNDGVPWTFVRVRADDVDEHHRSFELAELAPLLSAGRLVELGDDVAPDGAFTVALVEGQPYDLALRLGGTTTPAAPRVVRVSCNGIRVGDLAVPSGALGEYTVVLPAQAVRASTTVRLEVVQGPSAPNLRQALELESALFRPSVLGS